MTRTEHHDQVTLPEKSATKAVAAPAYRSPLHEMTRTTRTCLWNDSASIQELTYSIEHGAVGATCNPVIVVGVLKKEMNLWKDRIRRLIDEIPVATEEQIGWQLVREISAKGACLLEPRFRAHHDLTLTKKPLVEIGYFIASAAEPAPLQCLIGELAFDGCSEQGLLRVRLK